MKLAAQIVGLFAVAFFVELPAEEEKEYYRMQCYLPGALYPSVFDAGRL